MIYQISQKKFYLMVLVLMTCIGFGLALLFPALAMEPARPGEIEKLRVSGEFESRLDFVLKIGNHKVSPDLVKKFERKIQELRGLRVLSPPGGSDFSSIGSVKIFALLIDFNDHAHVNSETDIDDMLFGDGDAAKYPLESLADYYDRSSYGLLDIGGSTLGWYTTSYDRSTIPTNTTGRENLIKEALNSFDATHDFSQYDNDGDGDIDYFVVMWAGPNTGWGTFWWGYQPGWTDASYTLDGKNLTKYSWQWESNSPTVVIHETGHGLGLPDLYDYDPLVGPGTGVGGFDMMDGTAGDFNCFFKWMLDWLTPMVVSGGKQDITLDPTATTTDAVLIWPGISTGDIFSEFFMVQNRQDVGNDAGFWFAPDGLSIWHIDATLNSSGTGFEYNNSNTDHKLVRLMEADGLEEIEAYACCGGCTCKVADIGDLYNVGDEITQDTTPSSDKYDGTDSCVRVWDISDLGALPGDEILASFSTICNHPPVCNCDGPYTEECQGSTTTVALNGSGSSDPDGDTLTYSWTTNCPSGSFDDPTSPTPILSVDSSSGCSIICEVTLTVTDSVGDPSECSSMVTISDTLAPQITCPPDVTIECDELTDPSTTGYATATDNCDSNPAIIYVDVVTPSACPDDYVIARTWTATDACGNSSTCEQIVTVEDTTPPDIQCNAPATITPPDAPISFTATAIDNCDSDPSVLITGYDCYKYTKKGKRIDKTESCMVSFSGDTITINDSGGVRDNIDWTVRAADCSGNISEYTCHVVVINPGRGH